MRIFVPLFFLNWWVNSLPSQDQVTERPERPERQKQADPLSPFAALAALKAQLEAQKRNG